LDFVRPARPVSMSLVAGRGHYDAVISAVSAAELSVWVATANLKELLVEDHRARPGRRRSAKTRKEFRSILDVLDELAGRGVELRLLHAGLPSRPFRASLARHPRLAKGGLVQRVCPRVHLKTVVVDGRFAYVGSANWTGAGLGARGEGRRNFELGMISDDTMFLDDVQDLYDRIWRGAACTGCKLRSVCPSPLDGKKR
jgi:phosphatidylserine/phosphatidylglycerophosphate/cardiolipin synthase-like enzyme